MSVTIRKCRHCGKEFWLDDTKENPEWAEKGYCTYECMAQEEFGPGPKEEAEGQGYEGDPVEHVPQEVDEDYLSPTAEDEIRADLDAKKEEVAEKILEEEVDKERE